MDNVFVRTEKLLGKQAIDVLKNTHVMVVGAGGVGSYAIEALARSAVGKMTIIDHDDVDYSNINRQLHALHSTVGQSKVQLMALRLQDINPDIKVVYLQQYVDKENIDIIIDKADNQAPDIVIDCIDSITSKIILIEHCVKYGIKVISSMGAGNKIDATAFEVAGIFDTSVCPLAKVMRRELRARSVMENIPVVYSKEQPKPYRVPGSVAWVPSVAGLILAGTAVQLILKDKGVGYERSI